MTVVTPCNIQQVDEIIHVPSGNIFSKFAQQELWWIFFFYMTRPHISHHTTEEIMKIGLEVLPHPSYSLDLAPSDFHLFGPLKEAHRGIHFKDEEAVKTSVLRRQYLAFYRAGIHALVKRWTKTVEMDGYYIEK